MVAIKPTGAVPAPARYVLLLLVLIGGLQASAQLEIGRSLLSVGGGLISDGDTRIALTVGEAIVGTARSSSLIVTQGFQQPEDDRSSSVRTQNVLPLALYPNPAQQLVYLTMPLAAGDVGDVRVYDISGRAMLLNEQARPVGDGQFELDISGLARGSYLIELTNARTSYRAALTVMR